MIEYFEQLSQEEQEEITEVIQILYRQTFVLERKFDKRQGRMVPVRISCVEQTSGIYPCLLQSGRNYFAGKCAYGCDLHSGRTALG